MVARLNNLNGGGPIGLSVMVSDIRDQYAEALEVLLGPHGFAIHRVRSGDEAIWMVERKAVDAAVLDQDLPDMTGVRVLRTIRSLEPAMPIILVGWTASEPDQEHLLRNALELEAFSVLAEPVDLEVLLGQMARLFEIFFRLPGAADERVEPTRDGPDGILRFRKRG